MTKAELDKRIQSCLNEIGAEIKAEKYIEMFGYESGQYAIHQLLTDVLAAVIPEEMHSFATANGQPYDSIGDEAWNECVETIKTNAERLLRGDEK